MAGLGDCSQRVVRGLDLQEVRYRPWFTGANSQHAKSTPRVLIVSLGICLLFQVIPGDLRMARTATRRR